VLLDIHSFPPTYTWGLNEPVELLVLDNVPGHPVWRELVSTLQAANVAAFYMQSTGDNSIVLEAREHQILSVILEFNEELTAPRLAFISQLVVQFVLSPE
jgi:hypothetical protein